ESVAGNLVANCGFEAYTEDTAYHPTGWTESTYWDHMGWTSGHSGDYGLSAGPVSSGEGSVSSISQELTTVIGTAYSLSFYLSGGATYDASFTATLGDTTASSYVNELFSTWTLVQFAFTASAASTTLTFSFYNDPSYWYLDDVVFVDAGGDLTPPTVTLAQKAGQADPTKTGPVDFALVADEPLDTATVAAADFDVANGTIGTIACSGTPTACTIPVTPTADGAVTIAPSAAFSVRDLAGNTQTAAGGTDRSITYDTTPPVITASPKVRGLNVTITIVANETATWDCRLGTSGSWVENCGSPWTTSSLPKGTYTLYLRGADTLGNIAEESSVTFTVKSGKKAPLN
ncbi:MAG TPA: hypothetical protein VFV63_21380, partial [Ilumatobacteraceae bacterium]|nr:hypothetical protein [Ilumatobacteraceae bacterium]